MQELTEPALFASFCEKQNENSAGEGIPACLLYASHT